MYTVGKRATVYASESGRIATPEPGPERKPPRPQKAIVLAGQQSLKPGFQTLTLPDVGRTLRKWGLEPVFSPSHITKNKTGRGEWSLLGKGGWYSTVHHA